MSIRSLCCFFFAAQTWKMNYGIYTVATPIARAEADSHLFSSPSLALRFSIHFRLFDIQMPSFGLAEEHIYSMCATGVRVRVGSAAKVASLVVMCVRHKFKFRSVATNSRWRTMSGATAHIASSAAANKANSTPKWGANMSQNTITRQSPHTPRMATVMNVAHAVVVAQISMLSDICRRSVVRADHFVCLFVHAGVLPWLKLMVSSSTAVAKTLPNRFKLQRMWECGNANERQR